MNEKDKASGESGRDARLKQALKANLQRRKAQARARSKGADSESNIEEAGGQPDKGAEQDG
ncbi:hypothetical protein FPS10_25410 [Pseudoruegeria sp. M32A2M]|nr:hypothetical protein [Aliiruegeria sabulilitoris]NDR59737.1 hypothetical protein [Pseudoruegeria sp. M32A2M]